MALSACGSSSNSKASNKANASGSLLAATRATRQAFKGTNRPVAPSPRPAVKGKHVVVISSGQASISSQVPSDAAVAAARAIGWRVDLYDAKLNPSTYAPLVRQAIAAGADGIVLDAIDCQTVQQPLEEAKAKGIQVVPIYAFDCNDPHAGGAAQGLFTGAINFGPKAGDIDRFTEAYGADQANYIIDDSGNKAKILVVQDPEFTVLYYTYQGFKTTIGRSGGSQIVDTLEVTTADLTSGRLVAKIQAELLRHPEATWIKSPYTYVTTLGIVPASGPKAGQVKVMGGEGYEPELDLLRQGKITAVNSISSDWVGWAAIDTMNSLFRREKPPDSGIGWTIADKNHNLPPSGGFVPPVDYKAAFKKAWGMG
jgi:ribose transport system substrate-binding protein